MTWGGYVALFGEKSNPYRILIGGKARRKKTTRKTKT
jgi:hypothetical protein